jgi:hypothetical protein
MRRPVLPVLPVLAALALAATPAYAGGSQMNLSGYKITGITLAKVRSSSARSGYVFQFRGTVTNTTKQELTRAGSVGASLGACLAAKIQDNKGRKFDVTCDIPALLPSESAKNVVFAQSSAMSDSTSAKFCVSWLRCTSMLNPK